MFHQHVQYNTNSDERQQYGFYLYGCVCAWRIWQNKCNNILKQAKRITCRNIFLIFFYFVSNIYMLFSFYLRRTQCIFDICNLSVSVLISFNIPLPKKTHPKRTLIHIHIWLIWYDHYWCNKFVHVLIKHVVACFVVTCVCSLQMNHKSSSVTVKAKYLKAKDL